MKNFIIFFFEKKEEYGWENEHTTNDNIHTYITNGIGNMIEEETDTIDLIPSFLHWFILTLKSSEDLKQR